jgi:hypothetical protein
MQSRRSAGDAIDIRPLKRLASVLRRVLLLESDFMSPVVYSAKLGTWLAILTGEA